MTSPSASTASRPSTWWRVTPYFTARIPPAFVATLPPSDALFSPGHTGYTSPSGASAASSWSRLTPGLHDRDVVVGVDLEDLVHALEREDDAVGARRARAGQSGARAPGGDGHTELVTDAHDCGHIGGRSGPHDRERPHRSGRQRLVVGVVVADRVADQRRAGGPSTSSSRASRSAMAACVGGGPAPVKPAPVGDRARIGVLDGARAVRRRITFRSPGERTVHGPCTRTMHRTRLGVVDERRDSRHARRDRRSGRRRAPAREPRARRDHGPVAGGGERGRHAAAVPLARRARHRGPADGERARRPPRGARVDDDPYVQPPGHPRSRRAGAVGRRSARGGDRADHYGYISGGRRHDRPAPRARPGGAADRATTTGSRSWWLSTSSRRRPAKDPARVRTARYWQPRAARQLLEE